MAAKADTLGQAFLGVKLGCARCHDAPFHPFKQKDLFSMAAMLSGKAMKLPVTSTVPLVEGGRRPAVQITWKAGESIEPGWAFADLVKHDETGALPGGGKTESRRSLAALMVSPRNERFAQVVVNRVWKRYMGMGFVEPVDWARTKASHPELMQYLAREFVMSGYDLKGLARLIFSSHAHQRRPIELLPDSQLSTAHRLFAGPVRRKMTAEQLVDSLHVAVGKKFECEDLNLNPAGDRPPAQFLNMGKPTRAWQLTAVSNERDRPALALPIAQALVDVMTAYGWRQSRQSVTTVRDGAGRWFLADADAGGGQRGAGHASGAAFRRQRVYRTRATRSDARQIDRRGVPAHPVASCQRRRDPHVFRDSRASMPREKWPVRCPVTRS